jgi:DNA-binding MarR family transcriptional regulator
MCDGTVPGVERWEAMLDRVLELTVLLARDMSEGLARMGLTESRAHVVWELQRRGPCTQRALADALKVAPRTITTLIDALVETGFVTREPHPSDRRATLVTFTPHGEQTARALVEGHRELARLLFEDLPAGELEEFDAGLVDVVDRLRILTASTGDNPQVR